jgi:hypothetical protein
MKLIFQKSAIILFSGLLISSSYAGVLRDFLISNFVDMRGYRYCELLFQFDDRTEVWGTQGLNQCPQTDWNELDLDRIKSSNNATNLIANGPRYFVVNSSIGMDLPDESTRKFGNLEMRKLATVGMLDIERSFTEISVYRNNIWIFKEDEQIYLLIDTDGSEYIMQSYSLVIDASMEESKLSNLEEKLNLPVGWRYETRVLDSELRVPANGEAIVLRDNLGNTYQKIKGSRAL